MHEGNLGPRIARAVLLGTLLCAPLAGALAATPARIALVMGNSVYSALPALPTCLTSARDLTGALRGLGYQVIERPNVTSGGLAAAIDEFERALAAAPDASVLVYLCGYAAGMNNLPFLLPVSATIRRPSDVMTQGLLAKALIDTLVRGKPSRGLLALDLVPAEGIAAPELDKLSALPMPDGLGLIATLTAPPTTEPSALSRALVGAIAVPGVDSGALVAELQGRLQGNPATRIATLHLPLVARPVAVDEPPGASPSPSPSQAAAPVAATPRLVGPTPGSIKEFPDEAAMTERDRTLVQEALARLGYYGARVDGRFGPETRAAIRRFQHEIGVEMTGRLTGEQAGRLDIRN